MNAAPKMLNMVRSGIASVIPAHLGSNIARPATTMNETKIATPPIRGTEVVWTCRSNPGAATHPCAVAKFRTQRVKTRDSTTLLRKTSK